MNRDGPNAMPETHPGSMLHEGNSDPSSPATTSLLRLANGVLRHRALVAIVAVTVLLVVIARTLTMERTYTVHALFVPAGTRSAAAASGLAAQLGVSLATGDGGESPEFYVDLVTSRELLQRVSEAQFLVPHDQPRKGTLSDVYGVPPGPPRHRRRMILAHLASDVSARGDSRTGVIKVSVKTRWPTVSQEIATEILRQVESFNRERRRSRAAAEREFTEQRLADAASTLRASEERQRRFLEENRDFGAPALRIEQDRLSREVTMRQEIYTALAKALEQAKIEEVRDSPVITIVENPELPVAADERPLLVRTVLALFLGLALGVVLSLMRDAYDRANERNSPEVLEFRRLMRDTLHDVLRPWRRYRKSR